uniref:Uncharacterized protein n=1 Tax=Anas platyrhynchos TaxID=8839 RepID=A0A8B9QVR2_ANAPL
MAEPPGPFCVLGAGPGRYLCYCCGCSAGPGALCRGAPGSRLTPGSCPRREALRRGAVSLSLQEGGATLQLQGEAGHSTLHLCKLPVAEARTQLQALMFGLATSIKKLEERLEGPCVVPPLLWLLSPTLLLVPFPAQEGPGLSMVALEVHCAQVRCLVSPSRVACWPPGEGQASLLFHGSSVSPWSFHIGDQVWPLIIHGSWRHILGTEGLAGLPKQPADLCFPYPSCL